MRIAVITRRFFRAGGGAEGYAVALVRELAARHDIHVFSQQTDEPVPGVTYHALKFVSERPRWLNQWVFAISSYWQTRRGFEVVHSHENTWHGQVQTIHVRPVRLNLWQGRSSWRWLWQWFKVSLSPRLLTYVFLEASRFKPRPGRQVVAASALLRDDCLKAYPASELQVVLPGVDAPQHAMSPAEARRALGLTHAGRLLLFVANDYARKGLEALLQALTQLPRDVHLAIVGDTQQRARFTQRAQALQVQDRLHFLGTLPEVGPAYQAADVLVHPTLEDSYAMVVLEAMAHGLPVVVSAFPWCGIAAELTDHQQALLLTDPHDANTLADTLSRLLDDDALQTHLRAQGRTFAAARDWLHAALEYEKIYALTRLNS